MKLLIVFFVLALVSGCAIRKSGGPYEPATEAARDPLKAQSLTQEAAKLTDPARAEQLLRDALSADLYHGPAHNNLGVLYLKQGKLYEAASEFEWARKLMPGHPDPRMNLALTLERAGRVDAALAEYSAALEVYPDHLPTLQALARLQIRAAKPNARTRPALEQVSMRGQSQAWKDWARLQLTRLSP